MSVGKHITILVLTIATLAAFPVGAKGAGATGATGVPGAAGTAGAPRAAVAKSAGADLVRSDTVRMLMVPADYQALVAAQAVEQRVANFVKIYANNYRTMVSMAGQYNNAVAASDAAALLARYNNLTAINKHISDTVAVLWPPVFDNKSYSYNYILDKLGQRQLLSRFEAQAQATAAMNNDQAGQFLSDPIVHYRNEKILMLSYETDLATALKLGAARDSLTKAGNTFAGTDLTFPPIALTPKTFIDYAPVTLQATNVYSANNPVQRCVVYDNGTVYRILVGTYPTPQLASIFKGLSPVAYFPDKGPRGYFAGGYPTLKQAMEGLATVKKAAVRGAKPEIVVWRDASLSNISAESAKAEAAGTKFRAQIAGTDNLPQAVLNIIAAQGPGKDVTRSAAESGETVFIAAPFDTLIDALIAVEAIQAQAPELKVSVK